MIARRKLETQFTLVLTLVFLCGIILSGFILWQIGRYEAEEDVAAKAEILTKTINSVRSYTSNYIKPILEKQLSQEKEFIRQTVPAFAAREIFEGFREHPEYQGFFYKEATSNPTNQRDLADKFETEILKQFRAQPELNALSGYRIKEGRKLFYTSRPLAVKESSCLQCHSTPDQAPKSQIASYGDKSGFNWKLNNIVSAQTIYVPADEVFSRGRRTTLVMMGVFSSIFAISALLLNGLLKRRVIYPLKQLTAMTHQMTDGTMTQKQLEAFESSQITEVIQRADEPGQLARAFQQMAREVAYREQNLSQAVDQRTAQLAETMEEAKKAKAKAEDANKAKSRFLANMSHELRTPLNVILGFSQLMNRDKSHSPKQQEYLNTISRSGEYLLKLINNVLEMSKIEAGRITLNLTVFDLYGLLDALQQMFNLKAEEKGLKLIFNREPDLARFIKTDEGKLRQVLLNLIGNALKFTKEGQITLTVTQPKITDNEKITLEFNIEDTGPGIAPNDLDCLFKPFVQAGIGRDTPEGTGLGLSISREFVHLMGGEISVSSQLGVGTIFKFNVKAILAKEYIEERTYEDKGEVIALAAGQKTYRILIVEDKPENRRLLLELLEPVGFEVREASNGQEGVDICKQWLPDLIWLDIRMPGIDGYETLKQIRMLNGDTPKIIALTASVFEEDRLSALEKGFDDFVRKPFQTTLIFDKIAEHLGVTYCYEKTEEAVPEGLSSKDSQPIIAADLAVMPSDWIKQLHQGATRVNSKLILELIQQIPPIHANLIQRLTALVDSFGFEEIIALTQPHHHE